MTGNVEPANYARIDLMNAVRDFKLFAGANPLEDPSCKPALVRNSEANALRVGKPDNDQAVGEHGWESHDFNSSVGEP